MGIWNWELGVGCQSCEVCEVPVGSVGVGMWHLSESESVKVDCEPSRCIVERGTWEKLGSDGPWGDEPGRS